MTYFLTTAYKPGPGFACLSVRVLCQYTDSCVYYAEERTESVFRFPNMDFVASFKCVITVTDRVG